MATKRIRAKASPDDAGNAMLDAVGDYLGANGWDVLVIGSPRVQHQPHEAQFNYEFVLRFTGKQRAPKADER